MANIQFPTAEIENRRGAKEKERKKTVTPQYGLPVIMGGHKKKIQTRIKWISVEKPTVQHLERH